MEANNKISFYEVPLVCNAAAHIGCGSRSKPVLLDLEKLESVKQAWLNRKGTLVAVEWQNGIDKTTSQQIAAKVFKKHELPAGLLPANEYDERLRSFSQGNQWLAGSEVDRLSKEEAGIIADQLMAVINQKGKITRARETTFRGEIVGMFYEFFLNYDSLEELGDTNAYREKMLQIIKIGETYIGKGSMPDAVSLLEACSGHSNRCDHLSCKDSSCCKFPRGMDNYV